MSELPSDAGQAFLARRRRQNVLILLCIVLLLIALLLLLLRPVRSAVGNAARNFVFGRHVSEQLGTAGGGAADRPADVPHSGETGKTASSATNRSPAEAHRAEAPQLAEPQATVPSTAVTSPPPSQSGANLDGAAPAAQAASAPVGFLSDEFSRRLSSAGAKSGDIQVSLMWNNHNDLDLHCVDPFGEQIFFSHRRSRSGGELDVDMNVHGETAKPVENIYWAQSRAPSGTYKIYVHHFYNHGSSDPTAFRLRVQVRGETREFTNAVSFGDRPRLVHQFTLPANR